MRRLMLLALIALLTLSAACAQTFTPTTGSPWEGRDTAVSYWTYPMDLTDEGAVWDMLMQPMTVLDDGGKKGNAQKRQIVIRSEPDKASEGVGVVTNLTQGVHVLERGEEWTLIECYSSSFKASTVHAWNMLVQGYVPTRFLKTVQPNPSMALVVDKLTQRLYIFRDGGLYDTLYCSTGLCNPRQPYNETRSGEFLLCVPAVGGFKSDDMVCNMGIRFNGGDLIHESPHTIRNGKKNYWRGDSKMGTKASHGCIRVQRQRTPKGTNMKWIWNNKKNNIRIIIWEDWQGRQIASPDPDTVLYYDKSGKSYHVSDACYGKKSKTLTPFAWSELEDKTYAKLARCMYCVPPLRQAEIDAINALYAPGGDHDPAMTEARSKLKK